MPLPILPAHVAATSADLVRLFQRTERLWTQHIAETEQLDFGVAAWSTELPDVRDCNRLLEATVSPDDKPAHFLARLDHLYAPNGLRCEEIVLDASVTTQQAQLLGGKWSSAGFSLLIQDVMARNGSVAAVAALEIDGLMVLPARAALRQSRELAQQAAEGYTPQLADADMQHLDDPHTDALIVLEKGRPLGRVMVMAAGEVGRIDKVFVTPEARNRGIGHLLVRRALEICARSLFRHVLLDVRPTNQAAISLYQSLGFTKVGQVHVLWRNDDPVTPSP